MIGQTISHYKILEKLGEGGMGVVYKAEDITLDRLVALKFLPDHLSAGAADLERFVQEAKAAAALNHPNICTVYGIEQADGPDGIKNFIAMEFVDGKTLHEKKSSMSTKQAIDAGIQIAEGLAAAHEKGIVHRDIKPENIMVHKDGRVQIMDFGLAKLRGASRLTKEGSTVGTAGYMSPEQVQGLDTDHRSDIFSFGVLMYELLTGQLPFKGVHETAIAYEIVNVDSPPMSSIKSEIPVDLDAIVLECLEKDPNERTQSASQIAVDLKRYRKESSRLRASRIMPARPSQIIQTASGNNAEGTQMRAGWKSRVLWLAGGVLVGGVVTAAILLTVNSTTNQPLLTGAIHSTILLPSGSPLSIYGEASLRVARPALALSRDGSKLVYLGRSGIGFRLYLRELKTNNVVPLEGTEGAYQPFFSPDGEWVGFFAGTELRKVSLRGGKPTTLCTVDPLVYGACWSSSGQIFFGQIEGTQLSVISGEGGTKNVIGVGRINRARWPHLLPNETSLLVSRGDSISVVSIVDTTMVSLHLAGQNVHYVRSGHLVYGFRGKLYSVAFDANKLLVVGKPVQITSSLRDHSDPFGHFSVSDNGTIAYLTGGLPRTKLQWVDRKGSSQDLDYPFEDYHFVRLSPDGFHLALTTTRVERELWIYDLRRGSRLLVHSGERPRWPAWGPGTNNLTYAFSREGQAVIAYRPLDASAVATIMMPSGNSPQLDWSPNGKVLAYTSGDSTHFFAFKNNTNTPERLNSATGKICVSFSPDGQYVVFVEEHGGLWEVYAEPFPSTGQRWQISTSGGDEPLWANGGKQIVYLQRTKIWEVDVTYRPRFSTSQPRIAVEGDFVNALGYSYGVSPDGKKFLVLKEVETKVDYTDIELITNYFTTTKHESDKEK